MNIALVVYAVTTVSLPAGMSVDLTRSTQSMAAVGAPPAAIAFSQGGSLAVVMSQTNPGAASTNVDSRILVVRRDGTRVILKRPSDDVLANTFSIYAPGPSGKPTYPEARFVGVSLAADGTPFATVEYPFSGAYSGVEHTVYIWNGARWRSAVPAGPLPVEATNFNAAFADSPSRFVCNRRLSQHVSHSTRPRAIRTIKKIKRSSSSEHECSR